MKLINILAIAAFAVGSLGLTSCGGCCTSEEPVPPLRPLTAPIPVVYEK